MLLGFIFTLNVIIIQAICCDIFDSENKPFPCCASKQFACMLVAAVR